MNTMSSDFDLVQMNGSSNSGSPGGGQTGDGDGTGFDLATETRIKTKKPSLYRVLLLNDDYTPMEFVIEVLERFFGLNAELATQVMLQVHHMGKAGIGNFSRDVAETKAAMVVEYARQHEHPLLCQAEPII